MRKTYYSGILALTLFSTATNLSGQQASTTSVLAVQPSSGERIYVHTDKNAYLAGEIIWFKLYYMQAGTLQPLDLSKVGYVELLDRNSKPILQAKLEMDKRGANGSFYLPPSLISDKYILRAYTRWMRNFGIGDFFETPVTILNTVANVQAASVNLQQPAIHFYPEGGQLLSGTTSVVGFRVTDAMGHPADLSGIITNSKGDTVSSFATYRFGIGRLEMSFDASETYTAHFSIDEKAYKQELPRASDRGYGLQVREKGKENYEVKIQVKGIAQQTENMRLLVHADNQLLAAQQLTVMNDRETVTVLEKSQLKEGVNYITLLNGQQQPVCERLVFIRPVSIEKIDAITNKKNYGKREKVTIELNAAIANSTEKDSLNFSVSVYQAGAWEDNFAAGMASHRWLLPALQGEITAPEFYFSNNPEVNLATDNLMLTHGWRSFSTKQSNPLLPTTLTPELKGHMITGRVLRKSDGSPVPGELCYLTAPGFPFDLESARSDRQGWVHFEVDKYYGPGEIVVKAASDSAIHFMIELNNPFATDKLRGNYQSLILKNEWATALESGSIAMQAQNIYRADSLRRFSVPAQLDTLPFYGRAEYSYKLDDYKRFTTMEEVLREYVMPITVAMRGGKLNLSVIDELYKRSYDENVMVLVDGIPLMDHNKIFSYDPLRVKKLDVVTRRYVLGSANVGGVASFETNSGRFDAFELDPTVIMVDYEGLQLQREFYAPDYSVTNNSRIPDFRTTLFWKPTTVQSSTDKTQLSFYTGDQKGRYHVVIRGVTDSGKMLTGETVLEVE